MIRCHDEFKNWKQINFRSINTLIAAEFLHDLYNRYSPEINAIRFRHTIILFKNGKATSFAPLDEWNFLAEWFGERFLHADQEIYRNLDKLMVFKKPELTRLISKFKKTDFSAYDPVQLVFSLIDLQALSLGEIYKVNVVQIEHALNYTILKQLSNHFKQAEERQQILSCLIQSPNKTEAGIEDYEFKGIVLHGLSQQIKSISTDSKNDIYRKVLAHHKKYAYSHSAYGATPYGLTYYISQYNLYASKGKEWIRQQQAQEEEKHNGIRKAQGRYKKIIQHDELLLKNIDYMVKIGEMRDRNKAMMGKTNIWRDIIMNEISLRTNIARDILDLYLLSEVCNLVKHNIVLSQDILFLRKGGVIFSRSEDISYDYINTEQLLRSSTTHHLVGTCASSGKTKGRVKIVRSSSDVSKLDKGDIMVAPGTDFDLINAMQKSGAIITEEGGLLSHASVVSRELGIPCIIGVQNATLLLQDGMVVEIDADKGSIVILN